MPWPDWFNRVYEGVTEDLLDNSWPPPPVYTQLPDGTWRVEKFNGWGWIVTHHSTWDQALHMGQPTLPVKMPNQVQ